VAANAQLTGGGAKHRSPVELLVRLPEGDEWHCEINEGFCPTRDKRLLCLLIALHFLAASPQ
jgi:hypothetical protein